MSCADTSIQYLMDVISIHRTHNINVFYVPTLTGQQREYLNDIGFNYESCEPYCCKIEIVL